MHILSYISCTVYNILLNIFIKTWSTSELRVRLALWNQFKPSGKITDRSKAVLLLCLLCLYARLFICALCSPAGKGLTLALVCGVLLWVCHFPIGILGQVWYLIVSIPDLCTLTYFNATWIASKRLLSTNEYDWEISQSQTAGWPTVSRGRDTEQG